MSRIRISSYILPEIFNWSCFIFVMLSCARVWLSYR